MIKKSISPNLNHSNRFLTDYILQNYAFTYAYVLLLNIILTSFTKYFVSRGVLNMIDI